MKFCILKDKIKERLMEQYRNLFTRPNFRIRYVFHPFIEKEIGGKITYEPLVYSVRELRQAHQPVLREILKLIRMSV